MILAVTLMAQPQSSPRAQSLILFEPGSLGARKRLAAH
jgi:hypothetical protein